MCTIAELLSLVLATLLMLEPRCVRGEKAKAVNTTKLCREQPDIFVERELAQDGFHRELQTMIYSRSKIKSKSPAPLLLLVETLPSGAFADPHQLKFLQDGDAELQVPEKVDVELMQSQAGSHRVLAFLSLSKGELAVHIPVHLRYHQAQECQKLGPKATVTLQPAQVYFRLPDIDFPETCKQIVRLPCSPNTDVQCNWKQIQMEQVRPLTAEVPVGCLEDLPLVTMTTFLVYCLCCGAVAYSVLASGKKQQNKPAVQRSVSTERPSGALQGCRHLSQ